MPDTIETGDIFFLYSPRSSAVRGPSEVCELAFVLSPDRAHPRRLLVVRGNRLPPLASPEAPAGPGAIADVVAVRTRPEVLVEVLEQRADHAVGAREGSLHARPCGEGRYALALHDGHTDLSYALELPASSGPVQRDLGIVKEASYRVTVRVPVGVMPPGPPAGLGAVMPRVDLDLLDLEGSQLVLQPAAEPGLPVPARQPEGPATAEIFGELKLTAEKHPTEPLYQGIWK